MERSLVIRLGIAASVLAHVALVTLILLSTNVRPYSVEEPQFIPVDIVDPPKATPTPIPSVTPMPTPTPTPTPSPTPTPDFSFDLKQQPTTAASSALPQQQQAQPDTKPQPPAKRDAAAEPQPQPSPEQQSQPQAQPQPQPQASAAAPAPAAQSYAQPQPDLTVKYGVMLGLPSASPPPDTSGNGKSDDEAGPSAGTNLEGNLVAAFRNHLKSCSKLPASVRPSDNVMIKLRVRLAPDGRLAAEPEVIGGSGGAAMVKAIDLKQSAVDALAACQPYSMLPADRYREWRILELSFTPQNFSG